MSYYALPPVAEPHVILLRTVIEIEIVGHDMMFPWSSYPRSIIMLMVD